MKTQTNVIAARVSTLPITSAERREALAYISAGESLAGVFLKVANWLDASPSLKPSYQD